MTRARAFHALTFAVVAFALVLQFVLIWKGSAVLAETRPPARGVRVWRFCWYLTIWSNALVAWSTLTLALGRDRDSRVWRALRLDAVVLCLGGGIVHFFLLRPILHLHGWNAAADHLLHQVVPLVALVGWLAFGPRGRAKIADLRPFLVVPLAWFALTLVRGAIDGWYPYPFVDVHTHGYAGVALNGVVIGAALTLLALGAIALDGRLALRTSATDV